MRTSTKIRRLVCLAMVIALMTPVLCQTALAASFKAKINSSSAKIYASPSGSASVLGKGVRGLTVTVSAYEDGWARVYCKGRTGYMLIKYLNLSSRIALYTTRSSAVYKSASSSSSKLGTLGSGTKVYMLGMDGSYCRIQDKDGSVTGYIRSGCLSTKKPASAGSSAASGSSSSGSSSSGSSSTTSSMPSSLSSSTSSYSSGMSLSERLEYAIYVAQNQLGKPYASSANPPSSFDCAHLVRYAMNKAGFSVTSSAKSQGYDSDMEKISGTSSLRRGDIVCFNTNTSDSDLSDHTGIYLGSGYFIHASSGAGKVIVSSLSSGYYKNCFSWGRRPG